jgi:pyruvate dehydrogenase E1 component alpha subunit
VTEKALQFLGKYDPLKGQMVQILNPEGVCDDRLRPDLQEEELRLLYRQMVLARQMDRKALSLQRQGRFVTFAQLEGQEAAQVGSASALKPQDWIIPSYREFAAMLVHGVPLSLLCTYLVGSEEGHRMPQEVRCLPMSIPVGSHPLHAMGIAWAAKLRREPSVTVAYFGDGASSQGDVHEAMNFAAVYQVPCIFFCQNNHYAISVHRSQQAASPTLAQRGIAYGMPGIQIDGNDIFAVYAVTKEAVDRARSEGGPCLIEAVTYRIGAHTTADDPTRYREAGEVEEWRKRDPIDRFRRYLEARKLWNEDREQKLREGVSAEIDAAIEVAEKLPPPKAEDVFRYMFAELTPQLREQQAMLKAALRSEKR